MKFYCILCFIWMIRRALSDVTTPHQCLPAPSQKCFTVILDQQVNWNAAEKYCESNLPNGRLASIHNAFEGNVITSWLPFLTTDPWIGAYQIGSQPYQWTDASALDYANWLPGQPTNSCAQICHSSATNAGLNCQQGKWRTSDCESTNAQMICEYGNFSNSGSTTAAPPTVVLRSCNTNNGKCFALVQGAIEWTEAEKFCRTQVQNGTVASLGSITSQADANIIATFLQYPSLNNNLWIGAYAFGSPFFSWTDQSTFSYTNWAPGQPSSDPDGCVQVCLKNDSSCVQGMWTVAECKIQQSFVCENIQFTGDDCFDLKRKFSRLSSGIYLLSPPGTPAFHAYCDMETDGGGWTVFQRRLDGDLWFYNRTWNEYKNGFNNGLNNSLWLGNDLIHLLSTKDSNVELRIDLWGDRAPASSNPNIYLYGKYSSFYIDNEANYYTFHISRSSTGNASISDSSSGINANIGQRFSTGDNGDAQCSVSDSWQYGGWWFPTNCGYLTLNGKYIPAQWHSGYGLVWAINSDRYNPAQTRMMLRKMT